MFGRRKKHIIPPYNKAGKVPIIRSSICTGEQVAGFKDPVSGDSHDFAEFLSLYQVEESDIQREW